MRSLRLLNLFLVYSLIGIPVHGDDSIRYANGHLFSRLSQEDLKNFNMELLGESWVGSDGLIWGDAMVSSESRVSNLSYSEAVYYCNQIGPGARLPWLKEFVELRDQFGAKRSYVWDFPNLAVMNGILQHLNERLHFLKNGYRSQVLPHLNGIFWTNTSIKGHENLRLVFNGNTGDFDLKSASLSESKSAVRCVYQK